MSAKHHSLPWPKEAQERGILSFQHFRLGYRPNSARGASGPWRAAEGRRPLPAERGDDPTLPGHAAGGRPEEGRLPLASSLDARRLDSQNC